MVAFSDMALCKEDVGDCLETGVFRKKNGQASCEFFSRKNEGSNRSQPSAHTKYASYVTVYISLRYTGRKNLPPKHKESSNEPTTVTKTSTRGTQFATHFHTKKGKEGRRAKR